uniref:Translocation protein SEC62 n=1 Tax=Poecilia formosa TaxID=48698 RepID=A0A096M7D1_POEFO
MAERRRHKKRIQEVSEPTKEEKAVAKYLRFNCPTKSTNMMGHRVDYFIASKAVDCLLDSKWAKAKKGEEALFTTRESVVDYCNRLLKKQFFHRALKVMKSEVAETKKEKSPNIILGLSKALPLIDPLAQNDICSQKESSTTRVVIMKQDESPGTPKKKKEVKKKFKLEPHEDQLFLDGNEVYVWIYDPVHFKTFAMGLILVIAVIAATLFPLWPAEMRVGVYYLSVAAGCFVASILLLAVARCILFLIIWLVTGGRHHFWFLPNLTADVGFIDSFRPLYTHEYKGPRSSDKKGSDKTDEKDGAASLKAQKSDSDEKSDSEKKDDEEEDEDEESKEAKGDATEDRHSDTDSDRREDEGSQHSNGNDFEMITREELEQHTEEEDDEEEEEENEEEGEEEDEETQERKEGSESKVQTAET